MQVTSLKPHPRPFPLPFSSPIQPDQDLQCLLGAIHCLRGLVMAFQQQQHLFVPPLGISSSINGIHRILLNIHCSSIDNIRRILMLIFVLNACCSHPLILLLICKVVDFHTFRIPCFTDSIETAHQQYQDPDQDQEHIEPFAHQEYHPYVTSSYKSTVASTEQAHRHNRQVDTT
jgi:hypothetical protein